MCYQEKSKKVKLPKFAIGDIVTVEKFPDSERPGWASPMESFLNKECKIVGIINDDFSSLVFYSIQREGYFQTYLWPENRIKLKSVTPSVIFRQESDIVPKVKERTKRQIKPRSGKVVAL